MENWSLYTTLILIGILVGAALGAMLAIQASRLRDYSTPYYMPRDQPDYYGYGYPRRQHLGTGLLYVIAIICLIILWLAGSKLQANQAGIGFGLEWPGFQTSATARSVNQPGRVSYLEFGAYAGWEAAQEAKRYLSAESGQLLDVVQCLDAQAPFRVVSGPFRNAAEAEQYQHRYNLRAELAHYE